MESREYRIISPADGYNIEDGDFGGSSHSFFTPIVRNRSESNVSDDSLAADDYRFTLFQNPEKDAWFATEFAGHGGNIVSDKNKKQNSPKQHLFLIETDYDLYIVKMAEPFFISTVSTTNEDNEPVIMVIMWLPTVKFFYSFKTDLVQSENFNKNPPMLFLGKGTPCNTSSR